MKVERDEVKSHIDSYFGVEVILKDGFYWMKEITKDYHYISYSKEDNRISEDPIICGTMIMELKGGEVFLYPSISNIVDIEKTQVISRSELDTISRGLPIDILGNAPIVKLVDDKSRFIALARKANSQYYPMTDLGFYLRNED